MVFVSRMWFDKKYVFQSGADELKSLRNKNLPTARKITVNSVQRNSFSFVEDKIKSPPSISALSLTLLAMLVTSRKPGPVLTCYVTTYNIVIIVN